ncbi:MAG: hypothetical protein KGQ42_07585, partial [Alphaproteobacteria bacterium]|nr:hypothetical protein [Alphaproteobacteria bacterium]
MIEGRTRINYSLQIRAKSGGNHDVCTVLLKESLAVITPIMSIRLLTHNRIYHGIVSGSAHTVRLLFVSY